MNRIEFLKKAFLGVSGFSLLSVFSGKILASNVETQSKAIKLITTNIAGFPYYDGPENLSKINLEDPLVLQREKTNIQDFYAIEVFWKGYKLGYLPRQHNKIVANMMDAGVKPIANVRYINMEGSDWNRIYLKLELK